jgi:CRISPR-associated protein Cmr1
MKMIERCYTVRFLTPAFLGDAEQNARWRTPPFKHLLREWWRVAYAAERTFDVGSEAAVAAMRWEEGLLFGNAWLEHRKNGRKVTDFNKSLVRLRVDRWDDGKLKKAQWPRDDNVSHRDVQRPIGASLYLGYGPLVFSNGTMLKANAAVQAGEQGLLSLAWPDEFPLDLRRTLTERGAHQIFPERIDARVGQALWLAGRYGTLGGRSRNGWGSLALELQGGTTAPSAGSPPVREWRRCLDLDWPHAIGRDNRGTLIWQTQPHDDWKSLMKTLAVIKIGLRTQFKFNAGRDAPAPEHRHWLSYPVTNHSVRSWGNNARLPNSLRFKARLDAGSKLVGVIFHMPCLPPAAFSPDRRAIESVWERVHQFLDDPKQALERIPD